MRYSIIDDGISFRVWTRVAGVLLVSSFRDKDLGERHVSRDPDDDDPGDGTIRHTMTEGEARDYLREHPDTGYSESDLRKRDDGGSVQDDGYRGSHQAPGRDDDTSAPLHAMDEMYPGDIYSDMAWHLYGHGGGIQSIDRETARIVKSLRGRPDEMVSIYRAVPSDVDGGINPGDWVTVNRNYAKHHGEGPLGGDYKILERKVPAREVFTNADSIHEFGWDPEGSGKGSGEESGPDGAWR